MGVEGEDTGARAGKFTVEHRQTLQRPRRKAGRATGRVEKGVIPGTQPAELIPVDLSLFVSTRAFDLRQI